MGKLFSLKDWLTLKDAAQHLAIVLGEEVSVADVLQLGLANRLTISVNFVNHAEAKPGKIVSFSEAKKIPSLYPREDGTPMEIVAALRITDTDYLELSNEVCSIKGVLDLSMIGAEVISIEHMYQMLTNGPEITLVSLDGAFVKSADGTIYQLQERFEENKFCKGSAAYMRALEDKYAFSTIPPELLEQHKKSRETFLAEVRENNKTGNHAANYYPLNDLPEDSVLVIRTSALRDFEESLLNAVPSIDRPLAERERATLLVMLGALLKSLNIDISKPVKAGDFIAGETEKLGARVSTRTAQNHIKLIPDAIERKGKDGK